MGQAIIIIIIILSKGQAIIWLTMEWDCEPFRFRF